MPFFASHETYFASCPEARQLLVSIQSTVASLPNAALHQLRHARVQGKACLLLLPLSKKHIGVHPPVTQDAELVGELVLPQRKGQSLVPAQREPLPIELIGCVALALHREYCPSDVCG